MSFQLTLLYGDEGEEPQIAVGQSTDFAQFQQLIQRAIAPRRLLRRTQSPAPVLTTPRSWDDEWSPDDAAKLIIEIGHIKPTLQRLAPHRFGIDTWQTQLQIELGLEPSNLHESLTDIDGEPLVDQIEAMALQAVLVQVAIQFG